MTDTERRRFESIESLKRSAYGSFNDRRNYEWKLSLSIWTALAILLAGLVQPAKIEETFPLGASFAWIGAAIVGALLVFLHGYWSNGVSKANSIDKSIYLYYDLEMRKMLNLSFSENINMEIAKMSRTKGWRNWSHLAQISITVLLSAAAIVIIYVRSS
ncbi:MAG: hypothetical protein KKD92_10260 [Proteobacteria bacterium]|nr:hypothetical protein [Pseudomonadota bacterium]